MKLEDLKRSPTTVETHTRIYGNHYQGSVNLKDGIVEATVSARGVLPAELVGRGDIASNHEQIRDLQFVVQGVLATVKEMSEKRGVA